MPKVRIRSPKVKGARKSTRGRKKKVETRSSPSELGDSYRKSTSSRDADGYIKAESTKNRQKRVDLKQERETAKAKLKSKVKKSTKKKTDKSRAANAKVESDNKKIGQFPKKKKPKVSKETKARAKKLREEGIQVSFNTGGAIGTGAAQRGFGKATYSKKPY